MPARDLSVESMYEYGARAGLWRGLDQLQQRDLPLTAFVVGHVLKLIPEVGIALAEDGHELAGHGYRWLDYRQIPVELEKDHIQRTIALIEQISGKRPLGWLPGVSAPTPDVSSGRKAAFCMTRTPTTTTYPTLLAARSPSPPGSSL